MVKKEAMASTISTVSDKVRFMFFNACFSAEQAESIVKHIDAAIGMTDSIGDSAAVAFAAQFYSSIGYGKSIKTAFDQAGEFWSCRRQSRLMGKRNGAL